MARMAPVTFVKNTIEFVSRVYYNIHFHISKFIEMFSHPVNLVVDTLTIILAIWCLVNIVWQIGFDVDPATSTRLLIANRNIIGIFAVIQVYKLIGYIHGSSFDPIRIASRRLNTRPFRKVARKSIKTAMAILWRKFCRRLSLRYTWRQFVKLFKYLFVGNRVPLLEIFYAVGNLIYYWYMPPYGQIFGDWHDILWHKYAISGAVTLIAINEISRLGITILGRKTSPTALFIGSFIIIILIGCGLLLMPKSHYGELSFFESLFTATSAVCVNGLSIIDIPSVLTPFGQTIMLILIQVGGIGVMTFTCFFALSLTGRASLQNRFVIKDLVSADNMTDIFQTLKRIMYVTVIIEVISAWFIFDFMVDRVPSMPTEQLAFYSIFHSISAFCNAGFTNIDGGLMNPYIIGLKPLQIILGITVILGGLGFPLQSAAIDWCKCHTKLFFCRLFNIRNKTVYKSRLINANNRIIFFTHLGLVLIGMLIFFFTENGFTHEGKSFSTRLCDSFFMSVCSRTAGFCIVDLTHMGPITLLTLTILMWIGCAPLSTGGGIKVTTFAVALLNIKSVLRRRSTIEIYGRQISDESVRKAFSVIAISGIVMIVCAILFKVFDPHIGMTRLIFESCSAVFTGGMTLDVTLNLSMASHIVLLVEMFIGRIGILAFAMCFIDPAPKQYYSYPHETVMI